jgi:hypothetical protein
VRGGSVEVPQTVGLVIYPDREPQFMAAQHSSILINIMQPLTIVDFPPDLPDRPVEWTQVMLSAKLLILQPGAHQWMVFVRDGVSPEAVSQIIGGQVLLPIFCRVFGLNFDAPTLG